MATSTYTLSILGTTTATGIFTKVNAASDTETPTTVTTRSISIAPGQSDFTSVNIYNQDGLLFSGWRYPNLSLVNGGGSILNTGFIEATNQIGQYLKTIKAAVKTNYGTIESQTSNQGTITVSDSVDSWWRGLCTGSSVGTTAPTIAWQTPANNSTFSPGRVDLAAQATDSDGEISKVEFISGSTVIGTGRLTSDNTYTFSWNNVLAGTYSLTARATDDTGLQTTSTPPIAITVSSPINPGNQVPQITWTAPTTNTTHSPGTINLSARATDPDGTIQRVQFISGSTILGTGNLGSDSTYTFTWNNVPEGIYSLTARATDNNNAQTTTSPVTTLIVSGDGGGGGGSSNINPLINWISPSNKSIYATHASIPLRVQATDPDGSIESVEYMSGQTVIGTGRLIGNNQFEFSWNNVPAGSYLLTARATDNDNTEAVTFPPITILVNDSGTTDPDTPDEPTDPDQPDIPTYPGITPTDSKGNDLVTATPRETILKGSKADRAIRKSIAKSLSSHNNLALGLAALLALLTLINTPQETIRKLFFFWIPRKKPQAWGQVLDSSNHPVLGAVVHLLEAEFNRSVDQMTTDVSGEYGFLIAKTGGYRLLVSHPEYEQYTSVPFSISDINKLPHDLNVHLKPTRGVDFQIGYYTNLGWEKVKKIISLIRLPVLIIGTLLATYNAIQIRDTFSYANVGLYGILWLIEAFFLQLSRPYGRIIDQQTGQPLDRAIIRLTKVQGDQQIPVAVAITDTSGRFNFFVTKGQYVLSISRFGYQTTTQPLTVRKYGQVHLDVRIKPTSNFD
jgi:5-hydroxyisourate hydrolase-like protein (transthyretin family)